MADSNGRRVFDLVLRVTTMPHVDPSLSVAERVDAACDRFEAEWKAGNRPRIEDYLAAVPESDRQELRQALVAIELELQGRGLADTSVSQSSVRSDDKVVPVMTVDHVTGSPESSTTVGRFEIRGVLGSGAFGKVYRAFDPHLGREVALKVPLESAVKNDAECALFLKEARAAATINHPNVCQIHEVGEHTGRPYIVMALVPGQSLADVLKGRKEPMAEKQAALIVRKVAQALAAAHGKGIIHRDLKPANIMFDRERKDIVVMDFGLARGPRVADARATQSGVIMGTPAYMSPEQARGESKAVGPAGDVFSLGVILYELLTGTRPFAGTATEVIGQILHVDPEPPSKRRPSIDPRLEAVCLKAMAKDPAARFATMSEFAVAIDAILRAPKPTGPAAETAKAQETRQNTEPAGTETLGEVFAALSADRKQARAETAAAVEAAIARHRTPRWVFVLAGLLLVGGLTALGSIIFFTRSDKVKVTIELTDVDLSDKSLSFFLDEDPISAEALAKPIELTPGEHVLVVKRGKDIVKRVLLTVAGGRSPGLKYKDITPPPSLEKKLPPDEEDRKQQAGDRAAAEYTCSHGGFVLVDGDNGRVIAKAGDLPKEPFTLTGVNLFGIALTDAGAAVFKDCKSLTLLNLSHAQLTDAGLANFKDCKELVDLMLGSPNVTDAGLAHFKNCRLVTLGLACERVTDAGLVNFRDCKALVRLDLSGTRVTDAGLATFSDCGRLEHLSLSNTMVTDTWLRNVKGYERLSWLRLNGTRVTDVGLANLTNAKTLQILELRKTKVTAKGLDALHAALPKCRIEHDNGVIEPSTDPDRRAVEWVLGLGGDVHVESAGKRLPAKTAIELPNGDFVLVLASLANNSKVTDDGLGTLAGAKKLESLNLNGTSITPRGVAKLGQLTGLKYLNLCVPSVGDTEMAVVAALPNLYALEISYTQVGDAGLEQLKRCKGLNVLYLSQTKVTDAGLEHVTKLPQLSGLFLTKTRVTDAGLKHLMVIRSLKELDLRETAVTADGLRRLKAALPDCKITP